MKIYVASSWRNLIQPAIVHMLRRCGHEVYDFRNPPTSAGFSWKQVEPDWAPNRPVTAAQQVKMTSHPVARAGYESDLTALRECDALVYVLPCGRSASWEFGYAMGQGKPCYIVWNGEQEPELMFREATVLADMTALFDAFGEPVA